MSDSRQRQETRVDATGLNLGQVAAVKSGSLDEVLLGEMPLFTKALNSFAKKASSGAFFKCFLGTSRWHLPNSGHIQDHCP